MRAALVLMLPALGMVQCGRTPPEDFPVHAQASVASSAVLASSAASAASAVSAASAASAASVPSGRCILPTPNEPPPAVAPGHAPGCPPDPERLEPRAREPSGLRVAFPESKGASVEAEVVRSQHDTMRGLMYRTSLPEERGMLFDLGVREDHKFWMHNTCIPLDLLYVDEDGLIVGIVENAPTLNDDPRGVGCPSRYVLEVNAGWARRHGVKAGQPMSLPAGVGGL
jgi:uncharacterized protein